MKVLIIGGGLAGCEAAWQLSRLGIRVVLADKKPKHFSPAHKSKFLAELVCSNSFRSEEVTTGVGLLKAEMRALNSLILEAADNYKVPAGKALAVDRELFASYITDKLSNSPRVERICYDLQSLADPFLDKFEAVILAVGPLPSSALAMELVKLTGGELYFYDAIAPIVSADSIDYSKLFWGSRYRPEEKDYLNIPLTEKEYFDFVQALKQAKRVKAKEFEQEKHFEGCLPIEEMVQRGDLTLAFGPLKPVGLIDPKTGKQPFAVVQLRAENQDKTAFNLVGFQTKLTYPEQKRIFRMLPGLEKAEFLRLGSVHRNTFINAPKLLTPYLSLKSNPRLYFAGQITGVEGYVESAGCGLLVGLILAYKLLWGQDLPLPPPTTAMGALWTHLQKNQDNFQPSNVHFGLFPGLNKKMRKKERKLAYAKRAEQDFKLWLRGLNHLET